ncbi:hypothetical protein D3C80_1089300 [compost metagenome]
MQAVFVKTSNGIDASKAKQFVGDVAFALQIVGLAFYVNDVFFIEINVVPNISVYEKLIIRSG